MVVSRDFEGMRFTERRDLVDSVLWENLVTGVEVIPITPSELREKRSVILRDASRYWIKLV